MESSEQQLREEFDAKLAEQMEKVLDDVDDKISRMYETIEAKLKHVSKSFAGKFDFYEESFNESKKEMTEMFLKVSDRGGDNNSQESFLESQIEVINRDLELNAQLQGAKIDRLQTQIEKNTVEPGKMTRVEEKMN